MSEAMFAERGRGRTVDAHVIATCFDRNGRTVAFATAEGIVHVRGRDGDGWADVAAHDGAALCLAPLADGFLSGGDDGALARIDDGRAIPFARFDDSRSRTRWVEHCVTWAPVGAPTGAPAGAGGGADDRDTVIAVASGRSVRLLDPSGATVRAIEHPSTVTGLAFDALAGRRIAASHYNGASLSLVDADGGPPRVFSWKGSHVGVAVHPAAEAVITAMQENALHGWRVPDGHNMRMSGYPSKPHALSFSRTGRWLATSGADAVVLWPFFDGGPMGKPPVELAGGGGVLCTRVAFNPRQDNLAAGFADGTVLLADVASERVLPLCGPGRGSVSALAWSDDGAALAFGTETGAMVTIDLAKR